MHISHVDYIDLDPEPVLRFYIHGAPHRRFLDKHPSVVKAYRGMLREACNLNKVPIPISRPIMLSVHFINPTSPDLDNLILALCRALDGRSRAGVVTDDDLIHSIQADKLFTNPKGEGAINSAVYQRKIL